MYLKSLQLTNFRNYKNLKIDFSPGISILVGHNTAGKTNVLEAIRFLSFAKSFRVRSDKEVIKWGKSFTKIKGIVDDKDDRSEIEILIDIKENNYYKILKIDNVTKKTIDIIGKLSTVLFCPEDINLINSSPSDRRRFLNLVISQVDRSYCRDLIRFKNVLLNRNYLLSNIKHHRAQINELDFWDDKLIEAGSNLIIKRIEFIIFINKTISEIYRSVSNKKEDLMIEYKPGIDLPKDIYTEIISKEYRRQLLQKRDSEIKRSSTLLGPHRDNFKFFLDNKDLSLFGSRGEYRSCILALKLSELEFLKQKTETAPILLLDDIFSEFDEERKNLLSNVISDQQTIITATDATHLSEDLRNNANIFRVEDGKVAVER